MPTGYVLASQSKSDGSSDTPTKRDPPAKDTKSTDKTTKTNAHCKLIHDPPGDGSCGLHAIRHFLKKRGTSATIPATYRMYGVKHNMPDSMHDEDDLAAVCLHNKANLISHISGGHIRPYIWNSEWPTIKLLNTGAHWQLVDCDCVNNIYVGQYANLPLHENYLYVNCANRNCADNGGQAADFRAMFPKYDVNIVKPVQDIVFTKYDKEYHLAIGVAVDAREDPSKKNQYTRVKIICDAIEKYALANNLTVFMPMIGTAIFGNDLCCVKKLVNAMKCQKVICIFNETCLANYNNAKPCTHAGYMDIAHDTRLILKRGVYDAQSYNKITPEFKFEKMKNKWDDIERKLTAMGVKEIVELACAPGAFASIPDKKLKYIACHYAAGDFLLRDDVKADHTWRKYSDLPPFKDTCLLLDYCCDPDDPFIDYAIEAVKNRNCIVVSKFAAYHQREDDAPDQVNTVNRFSNCKVDLFRNDASSAVSSEMYYVVRKPDQTTPSASIDIDNAQKKIDDIMLEKQLKQKCDCVAKYTINADLSWTHDESQFKLFKKQLRDDIKDYDFYDVNIQKIIDDAKLCEPKITATLGVAGACKSQQILTSTCGLCSLLIAPLRNVVTQAGKAVCISTDSRAATFVKAIAILADKRRNLRNVFVDEVFLVNPYFISLYKSIRPDATFHAMGDPYQIKADFHGTAPEYKITSIGKYLLLSKRVPACLDSLLNNYVPGFRGNTNKKNRMEHVDKLTPGDMGKHDILICHTQAVKENLKKEGFRVLTAHEAMGSTFPKVYVHTADISNITRDKASYVYTAMSRTAGDIVFYGSKAQIDEYFTILGSAVERAAAAPQVDVVPHGDTKTEIVEERETLTEPLRPLTCEPHDISSVVEVLAKIYPAKNEHIEGVTLHRRLKLIPEITEPTAYMKLSPEMLQQPNIKVNGKMLYPRKLFCQTYHGKDVMGKVGTAIKRYLGKRKNISKHAFKELVNLHLKGAKKFLKDPRYWTNFKIGHEQVLDNFFKYCRNLQKKFAKSISEEAAVALAEEELKLYCGAIDDNTTKANFTNYVKFFVDQFNSGFDKGADLENQFTDIAIDYLTRNNIDKDKYTQITMEWHDPRNRYVNFHMKSQPKEIRKLYWDTHDKAGQGISAYGKMHNILLCALQTTLHDWVVSNLRDDVIWAVDKSDEHIAEVMISKGAMSAAYNENLVKFCCDASQFDSTQLEQGIAAICLLAQIAGCPDETIEFYRNVRAEWLAITVDELDSLVAHMKFTARFYMTSGSLMTLTGNTVYNMMMIGICYNITNLAFAAFKGDDSFIVCEKITKATYFGMSMAEYCGYQLKDEYPDVPEFIANFVTPLGFFPDVLRRVSRVCSRIVTHPDQWYEIRKSIRDCIAVIKTPEAMHLGCKIAAIAYQNMGLAISHDEVYKLLSFLHQAAQSQELETDMQCNWEIIFLELDKLGHSLNALGEVLA